MSKITEVRHVINKRVGGTDDDPELESVDRWEYEFSDDATADEKQAVRAYGCRSPEEFRDAIDWWNAIENASNFKGFMKSDDTPRSRPGRRGNGN